MQVRMRLFTLAMLACALFPWTAPGQDYSYKGRLYGGLGTGRFYDDEGSLGNGPTYRAGSEWRPLKHLGIGGELMGIHHRRRDYFHVQGNDVAFSVDAICYFSKSRLQPYVLGGIGILLPHYSYSWPGLPDAGSFKASKQDRAINLGAGAKFFINRRWSLDPEARLLLSSPNGYALVNYFSMAASYHW